jgi:N-acyl-D-amino-acid deacylase
MSNQRKTITRRTALAGLGGLAVASQVIRLGDEPGARAQARPAARSASAAIPITGKAGPGLKPFDQAMLRIMDRHGIPGAALAIAKNGKLVLAKGYGWADINTGEPIRPDTLFGLASLSKPITAVSTLKLMEQGKLGLDDPIFGYLKHIGPPRGARIDPRLRNVTVRQCLNHSGGWDRSVRGDPVNWEPQICRTYRVRPPLSPGQFISFAMTLPLDFHPGTDAKYSNVGYILLGEMVERISGQAYERFAIENVLEPMGIKRASLLAIAGKYIAGEAHRYLPGSFAALPALAFPMIKATGGWCASVVDVARLMCNLEGSRDEPVLGEKARKLMLAPPPRPLKPRPNGTYFGLGWDSVFLKDNAFGYYKDGSYQGMRTYMKRLPSGVNWVILYNCSMEFDPQDMQTGSRTVQEVRRFIEEMGKYPDIDLFKEFA